MKWGVCCPYWGWALPHKAPPSGHKRPLATHMRGAVLAFPDQDRSHTCSVRDRPPQLCIDRKAGRHSPQPREWLPFQRNSLVATLAALGMILGAAYSLWLYNRVVSGNLKPDFLHKFSDLNGREVFIFIPFLVGVVWMGVYPKVFLDCMHTSVSNLVQHGKFN